MQWAWLFLASAASGCNGGSDDKTGSTGDTSTPEDTTPTTPAPDLTGSFTGTFTSTVTGSGGTLEAALDQQTAALTGTIELVGSPCFGVLDVTGSVTDDAFTLSAVAVGTEVTMEGTIASDHLEGTYEVVTGGACTGDYGTFTADR